MPLVGKGQFKGHFSLAIIGETRGPALVLTREGVLETQQPHVRGGDVVKFCQLGPGRGWICSQPDSLNCRGVIDDLRLVSRTARCAADNRPAAEIGSVARGEETRKWGGAV